MDCYPEELRCFTAKYASLQKHSRCISTDMVRNGLKDCFSNVDESTFLDECYEISSFLCLDQSRCMPRKFLCDGVQNCIDGSDEIEYCQYPTMYRVNKPNSDVFIATWLSLFADNRYIEFMVYSTNKEVYFEGKRLVSKFMFGLKCETNYLNQEYGYLKTTLPDLVEESEEKFYCKNEVDRCYDSSIKSTCSYCFDKTRILNSQLCDGTFDCRDLSDECLCENSKAKALCEVYFPIDSDGAKNLSFDIVCNLQVDLPGSLDEKFCSYEIFDVFKFDPENKVETRKHNCAKGKTALNVSVGMVKERYADDFSTTPNYLSSLSETVGVICNLKYECPFKEDECSGECFNFDKFPYCFNFVFPQNTTISQYDTEPDDDWYGETQRFYYQNTILTYIMDDEFEDFTPLVYIANFFNSEVNFVDNINNKSFAIHSSSFKICEENYLNCPWLFRCHPNKKKLIDIGKVCDFNIDCQDESDEKYCSSKTHFNCTSGSPVSISKTKVGDSELDCFDKSDECIENPFSSDKEMIKNTYLRNFVWVVSVSIVALNSVVIAKNLLKVKKIKSKHSIKFYNLLFIINLAFSDVILGFVLTFITLKSRQLSGEYCSRDLEWRSSVGCDVVGVLTLLSSQTSLLILLLVTMFRLYTVYRPYESLDIKPFKVYILVSFCWVFSIILSMTPVILENEFTQKYVVSKNIYLKNKKVDRLIDSNTLQAITENFNNVEKLVTEKSNKIVMEMNDSKNFTSLYYTHPTLNVKIKNSFGFYSSSSVCLPDFYSESFLALRFSFALLSFNLLVITVICVGYVLIFYNIQRKQVDQRTKEKSSQNEKTMFVRVFLIVATDVACWLPIIIMSFLRFLGYRVPDIAHPISSIVLLPINSLLNPVLYSKIEAFIFRKLVFLFELLTKKK